MFFLEPTQFSVSFLCIRLHPQKNASQVRQTVSFHGHWINHSRCFQIAKTFVLLSVEKLNPIAQSNQYHAVEKFKTWLQKFLIFKADSAPFYVLDANQHFEIIRSSLFSSNSISMG